MASEANTTEAEKTPQKRYFQYLNHLLRPHQRHLRDPLKHTRTRSTAQDDLLEPDRCLQRLLEYLIPRNPLPPASHNDPQNHSLERPLNVTDALSYLDAVKVQFHEQPDVYNHFLDIMKDFKSQLIDTPGVIKRVSYLFNGHPSLIQGFNTFLPAGYRIECSTDAHASNFITVTTPTGTMTQATNDGGKGPFLWSTSLNSDPGSSGPFPSIQNVMGHPSLVLAGPGSDVFANGAPPHQSLQLPMSPDPSMYGGLDSQAIEPAVQYVQKIKQRCDPDTYKQFLEILSQYHQRPETIDEREVSAQISRLFKDAPDLRSDFRIFMPEKSQQLFEDPEDLYNGGPGPNSGSTLPQKRKRKPNDREKEKDKDLTSKAGPSTKRVKQQHTTTDISPQPLHPHVPKYRDDDESHFFDRVKRTLDNRETYNEFLKLVNLFTQNHIDTGRLVRSSMSFLGDGELMRQFREILGWDERREREYWLAEQQSSSNEEWVRRRGPGGATAGFLDRPSGAELSVRFGSYRKLPTSEVNVTCSGRDDMCRSVLNDEWVSHPTWSSEDSGFIAHKKNVYEEALHRSEEERHEYDFHIEAIVRTISMLEPINTKIAQLPPEERNSFKLKPNLNGSGKSIHQRVIKKIYGREPGLEVVQAMQDVPALPSPVVLSRLKQKEEEWKRAQREWNKVWREVDARNYIKSLDHQSITFKASDKKSLTTKAFVNQIEAARDEQMAKRASLIDPLFSRTRPRHQLEFVIDNEVVLQDVMKLTFSFLDRTQAQIPWAERKRIEGFLRVFVPLFFVLDAPSFNATFAAAQEAGDSEMSDMASISVAEESEFVSITGGTSRTGRSRKNGGGVGSGSGDLRKKLLKSEQAKSTSRKTRAQEAGTTPSASRRASPAMTDPMVVDTEEGTSDQGVASSSVGPGKRATRKNLFFSNTIFYTLLRLLEVLYSRLSLFKSIAAKVALQSPNGLQRNPIANSLGLPSLMDLAQLDDRSLGAEHFYDLMLESCERLFDGELEQAVFEDQMRFMFGTKEAYKIFTIDKVVGAFIKQVQLVLSDAKSQELLDLLKRDRSLTTLTSQDHINHRRQAEKVIGPDENLFRIDWLSDSKTVTIQLLGKDDSSFDNSEVLTGRWNTYVNSFVSDDETEGVPGSRVTRPFLRKNLSPAADGSHPTVLARGALEIRVCVRTYRLFFVSKSEDVLWRLTDATETAQMEERVRARKVQRLEWLQKMEKDGWPS